MAFRCDAATLERLEWPRLARCLAALAATERAANGMLGDDGDGRPLFAETRASVEERLEETGEIRGLLDDEQMPPFGGIADLRPMLDVARRGGLLDAGQLVQVLSTLEGAGRLRAFFAERSDEAQRLGDLAGTLPGFRALVGELRGVLTPEGEVRDDASPELRRVRRQVRSLESEIDGRMASLLRDAALQPHLQDDFVTQREGRPVVPVRAEARGRVKGIVHDVSSSGTTVFIEPEAVVELGNRLRLARIDVDRELERLLRQLCASVADREVDIDAAGATLELLDRALARGRLSQRLHATPPLLRAGPPGVDGESVALRALRHPLLLLEAGLDFDDVIANDLVLPPGVRGLVISGPNAGGKTVIAKALGLAALALRAGLHLPCDAGSRMPILDAVHADIGDEQDLRSGLSTFSARMSNLARILEESDSHSLVIVDEIGEGTEPGEGAALAQAVLEGLVDRGATVVATTHFNRLKELAGSDERFANASAEFDAETLMPTYRVRVGAPGSSGATWVAERMGLDGQVVDRARSLLDSEDRKLESLTRSLSELRQELEAERGEALRVREESESARAAYEARLASLRSAREKALSAMKSELEAAFGEAREEIASVMRDLQSGGAKRTGQAANRAHARLERTRERTERVERAHADPEPRREIAWDAVEPGARLRIDGIPGEPVYVEGPDRRGRVVVRGGAARTTVPADRVVRVLGALPKPAHRPSRVDVDREPESESGSAVDSECDLRGLRVDEALDRADAHLQRLLGSGVKQVCFIHGHGTGALRSAVRAWLRDLPYVEGFEAGARSQGGNGVTVATLTH
ncbi:MAG: Smr/MutS family protein [Deltaproteobacteria bacterium]|nr:Smr/MutS family protein [Deltaproteobacteria bacterium]MBW2415101.1 Smr/MutS family protein [Deltaproteobacteria bacterium]